MHPHHLHATTALWSYRHARNELTHAITAARMEPPDGLHGRTYGTRHGVGGHSDGILALVVDDSQLTRLRRHARHTTATITWLASHAAPGPGDPAARLIAAIPSLAPSTSAHITAWVREADQRIRRALGMPADHAPLPGVPCPHCGTRRLQACTAAPDRTAWTVVCAAGCHCTGTDCGCTAVPGTTPAAGVAHIWPWTTIVRPAQLGHAA